uniref:Polygalacturonase n=1 Tax=Kalanchoe fedtschenkoi TaxID=63787 RepID=A0A7N1A8T9_KALFE
MKYGAKGDGRTNDAPAFQKAWKDVCSRGGTLLIPKGNTFLLYPTEFEGPCKSSGVHVQVLGKIVSPTQKQAWEKQCNDWISFLQINNLVVDGSGEFNGNGEVWWSKRLNCGDRPTNIAFNRCTNLKVSGINSRNSARNHFSISHCDGAVISDITAIAPEDSPNTDGIDISHSTDIIVKDSRIGSGDDCIAINNLCQSINISNIDCGPGHGISVGSLGKGGEEAQVEDIHVHDCKFTGTSNGARIKTWVGGEGYARSITFDQLVMSNVENPIIINQNYFDHKESTVAISDVKFLNIQGTCQGKHAIIFDCSSYGSGCTDIEIKNVKITGDDADALCKNAQVEQSLTSPEVICS